MPTSAYRITAGGARKTSAPQGTALKAEQRSTRRHRGNTMPRCTQFLLVLALGPGLLNGQVAVTTWQNDNSRTGQNTSETTLTRTLVGSVNTFGKLCSTTVDGQVHAQPLVMNVVIGGVRHTAVFVVTKAATVYVFDGLNFTPGQPCVQLAKRHLPPPASLAAGGGLLGTPVIDPATNTLYLVAGMQINATPVHNVYALDITSKSLTDKVPPVQVSGGVFLSANQVQRPGLLGLTGSSGAFSTVYVG